MSRLERFQAFCEDIAVRAEYGESDARFIRGTVIASVLIAAGVVIAALLAWRV